MLTISSEESLLNGWFASFYIQNDYSIEWVMSMPSSISDIYDVGTAFYRPGERLGPRVLDSFLVVRIRSGSVDVSLNGRSYEVHPDQLVVSLPGTQELWRWDVKHPTVHDYIAWSFKELPEDLPDPASWRLHGEIRPKGLIHGLYDHILDLNDRARGQRQDEQKRALDLMITSFINRTDSAVRDDRVHPSVDRVLEFLGQRWAEHEYRPPSIPELCEAAGLSQARLTRVFKDHCGKPPVRFCEALRLHDGAHRLVGSARSVGEVAEALGYETQFHFSRHLRAAHDLPPLRFRQTYRNRPETLSERPAAFLRAYARVRQYRRLSD